MVGSRVTEECICGFAADTLAVKAPLVSCLLAVGYRWGYGVLCARGYVMTPSTASGNDMTGGCSSSTSIRISTRSLPVRLVTLSST